jgi:hypothetical protein
LTHRGNRLCYCNSGVNGGNRLCYCKSGLDHRKN